MKHVLNFLKFIIDFFIKILFYILKYFVIWFYSKVNYVNNFNLFIISERVELYHTNCFSQYIYIYIYHTNFNTYIMIHSADMTCIIKLLILNQKFVVGD